VLGRDGLRERWGSREGRSAVSSLNFPDRQGRLFSRRRVLHSNGRVRTSGSAETGVGGLVQVMRGDELVHGRERISGGAPAVD